MANGMGTNAARRNGPAANPNSFASLKKSADWVRIPKSVCIDDDAPEWPEYMTEPSTEELLFWRELWKKPQAVFWKRDSMTPAVAMYCRTFISAAKPGGFVTERTAAHRQSDALLLTTPALMAAKVLIVEDEDFESETGLGAPMPGIRRISSAGTGVRSRFTVVSPAQDEEDDSAASGDDD